MTILTSSLKSGLIGFVLMSLIHYVSELYGTQFGSIITALPIGLISMWLFRNNQGKRFGYDATMTNILVIIAYFSYDYISKYKSNHIAIIFSLIIWSIGGTILYYTKLLK